MIPAEQWALLDMQPGGCVGPNAGHIVTRYRAVQADALRETAAYRAKADRLEAMATELEG